MADNNYRAGIIGLGMIGGADSASAEAIGQSVDRLDGRLQSRLLDPRTSRVMDLGGSTRTGGSGIGAV